MRTPLGKTGCWDKDARQGVSKVEQRSPDEGPLHMERLVLECNCMHSTFSVSEGTGAAGNPSLLVLQLLMWQYRLFLVSQGQMQSFVSKQEMFPSLFCREEHYNCTVSTVTHAKCCSSTAKQAQVGCLL